MSEEIIGYVILSDWALWDTVSVLLYPSREAAIKVGYGLLEDIQERRASSVDLKGKKCELAKNGDVHIDGVYVEVRPVIRVDKEIDESVT